MEKTLNRFVVIMCLMFGAYFMMYSFVMAKYPIKFADTVIYESNKVEIEPQIIFGIIAIESNFDRFAKSSSGAYGLMQIMPQTAKFVEGFDKFNAEENKTLFDASYNIKIGTTYFKYLQNKFGSDMLAICAYNAGETVVLEWLNSKIISKNEFKKEQIPYPETKNYVKRFEKALKIYQFRIK